MREKGRTLDFIERFHQGRICQRDMNRKGEERRKGKEGEGTEGDRVVCHDDSDTIPNVAKS